LGKKTSKIARHGDALYCCNTSAHPKATAIVFPCLSLSLSFPKGIYVSLSCPKGMRLKSCEGNHKS
jgi:hypothetical protein